MAKRPERKGLSRKASSKQRDASLFTPSERSLLDLSTAGALAQAAPAEVKATLGRMRAARDKWRSLAAHQDRGAKRAPRAVSAANARSRDKAEVFAGAVKRLEAHLVEGESGEQLKAVAARGRKTPKKHRTAAHRTSRAGLRATLSRAAAALNESVVKPAAAVVRKAAAAAASTAASTKASVVGTATPAATSAKRSGSASATRTRSAGKAKKPLVPSSGQAVRFDAAKQRSLRTAAKHSRIAVGGLATRRKSHVVASGKRAQARRDKRR